MLLRKGGTYGADRRAQHACGFARPGALPVRARGVVEGVLQDARDRTVVFGSYEDEARGSHYLAFKADDRFSLVGIVVLVVQWQVTDLQQFE